MYSLKDHTIERMFRIWSVVLVEARNTVPHNTGIASTRLTYGCLGEAVNCSFLPHIVQHKTYTTFIDAQFDSPHWRSNVCPEAWLVIKLHFGTIWQSWQCGLLQGPDTLEMTSPWSFSLARTSSFLKFRGWRNESNGASSSMSRIESDASNTDYSYPTDS